FSPNYFEAIAWLPLGCLAISDLAAGRRCRGASVLALATGMSWLAGYPQTTSTPGRAWCSAVDSCAARTASVRVDLAEREPPLAAPGPLRAPLHLDQRRCSSAGPPRGEGPAHRSSRWKSGDGMWRRTSMIGRHLRGT